MISREEYLQWNNIEPPVAEPVGDPPVVTSPAEAAGPDAEEAPLANPQSDGDAADIPLGAVEPEDASAVEERSVRHRLRGLPRDMIRPGGALGPDDPERLECPECHYALNESPQSGDVGRTTTAGNVIDCPSCGTTLRLEVDVIADDADAPGRPQLVLRNARGPVADLLTPEIENARNSAIEATLGWLAMMVRNPDGPTLDQLLDSDDLRFRLQQSKLFRPAFLAGVYSATHITADGDIVRQQRFRPLDSRVLVVLGHVRGELERRRLRQRSRQATAAGDSGQPVHGGVRMSCGHCGDAVIVEAAESNDDARVTCTARRHVDGACALVGTRRLSVINVSLRSGLVTTLHDFDCVNTLYEASIAAMYAARPDLVISGALPPLGTWANTVDDALGSQDEEPLLDEEEFQRREAAWEVLEAGDWRRALADGTSITLEDLLLTIQSLKAAGLPEGLRRLNLKRTTRAFAKTVQAKSLARWPSLDDFRVLTRILAEQIKCVPSTISLDRLVESITLRQGTDQEPSADQWSATCNLHVKVLLELILPPAYRPLVGRYGAGLLSIRFEIGDREASERIVSAIRERITEHQPQREIAPDFEMSQSQVSRLLGRPPRTPWQSSIEEDTIAVREADRRRSIRESLRFDPAPWTIQSDTRFLKNLKRALKAVKAERPAFPVKEFRSLSWRLDAGGDDDVEPEGREDPPQLWSGQFPTPSPSLDLSSPELHAHELSLAFPFLTRDVNAVYQRCLFDRLQSERRRLRRLGGRQPLGSSGKLRALQQAERTLRDFERGIVRPHDACLVALAIRAQGGWEHLLIDALSRADNTSERISTYVGYAPAVIEVHRHLLTDFPQFTPPQSERDVDQRVAWTLQMFLRSVASHAARSVSIDSWQSSVIWGEFPWALGCRRHRHCCQTVKSWQMRWSSSASG